MPDEQTKTETPLAGPILTAMPAPTVDPLTELNQTKQSLKYAREQLQQTQIGLKEAQEHIAYLEGNALILALSNLDSGQCLTDGGEKLKGLCLDVQTRQAKGEFILKLVVKPAGNAMELHPSFKVTPPKEETAPGIFYTDDKGGLTRNDPRQRTFSFGQRRDRNDEREDEQLR